MSAKYPPQLRYHDSFPITPPLIFSFISGIIAGLLIHLHKKSTMELNLKNLEANRCHSSERRRDQKICFEVVFHALYVMWLHLVTSLRKKQFNIVRQRTASTVTVLPVLCSKKYGLIIPLAHSAWFFLNSMWIYTVLFYTQFGYGGL